MHQDPGQMAFYTSLVGLPWCLKIIFGLITDNVKIFGLNRKPYLVFFGFLQFAVMIVLFTHNGKMNPDQICILLMTASMAMAFCNVVIDAILVIQSRKDT